jgi:hypothetical protein
MEDRKMKKITNYNVQNYKPNDIHAAMQYHSDSPPFPSFPASFFFPASLFTPWPPEAKNIPPKFFAYSVHQFEIAQFLTS